MKRQLLDEAPFARLTVPFAAGIALQEFLPAMFIGVPLVIGLFFAIRHIGSLHRIDTRFRDRSYFAIACYALFLTAGAWTWQVSNRQETPDISLNNCPYAVARIDETDPDSGRSISCRSTIIARVETDRQLTAADIAVLLRIERDSLDGHPQAGDLLLFRPRIAPIANKQNPEAFDYASLMRHRGYLYTQYLAEGGWRRIARDESPTLSQRAMQLRDDALARIDSGGFSPAARSILKALLLGYTGEIDEEQREAFSVAGLSHVLAVSGLHLGIVWALAAALLAPLSWLHLRRLRAVVIMALLWAYALLTGLSPSVVRACVMASVVLAGIIVGRKARPMNSLFVAAFLMLLHDPHTLFQVGFQLSFLSVFSILLFYRPLFEWLPHTGRLSRRIASLLAVSAAAQVGTLPLVIYYFHLLPLTGLLTNLIVVPLLPILLGSGFLWLLLATTGVQSGFLAGCVNRMAEGLDALSRLVDGYAWSSIQGIWIEPAELVLCFILIFGGGAVLLSRQARGVVVLLGTALIFLLADTWGGPAPLRNLWAIYQESGGTTTLNFIDNGRNMLLPLDTLPTRTIEKEAGRFWIKNGVGEYTFVADSTTCGHLAIALPYMVFGDSRFLVLGDDRWKGTTSPRRMSIDYAIVVPGFRGKIDPVRQIFDIRQVILAHNLPYFQRKSLEEECRRLRIACHSIRSDGAFVAPVSPAVRNRKRVSD